VIVGDCYHLAELKTVYRLRPRHVVDIGAHIGCFTLAAKALWRSAEIVCIEPLQRSVELLRSNTSNLNDVSILACAAGYNGASVFMDDTQRATGGGSMITPQYKKFLDDTQGWGAYSPVQEQVTSITIESVMDHLDFKWIDLLKLDCEGGEVDIIKSMCVDTVEKIGWVIGEYHTYGLEFMELVKHRFPDHRVWLQETGAKIGMFRLIPPEALS